MTIVNGNAKISHLRVTQDFFFFGDLGHASELPYQSTACYKNFPGFNAFCRNSPWLELLSLLLFFKRSKINTKIVQYCHSNGSNFLSVQTAEVWKLFFVVPRTPFLTFFFSRFRTINSEAKLCFFPKLVWKCHLCSPTSFRLISLTHVFPNPFERLYSSSKLLPRRLSTWQVND